MQNTYNSWFFSCPFKIGFVEIYCKRCRFSTLEKGSISAYDEKNKYLFNNKMYLYIDRYIKSTHKMHKMKQ